MATRPRRFIANNPLAQNPKLEPIHQSLYSGGSLASGALPRELLLFQYAIGGTVAGALTGAVAMANASLLQTNMRTAGFVAAPKVFLIEGLRFKVSLLTPPFTATAPLAKVTNLLTAAAEQDMLTDLIRIRESGIFVLDIGPKNYQECHLFDVPDDAGVGGLAANSVATTVAATTNAFQFMAPHGAGGRKRFRQYPVVIPAQQQFQVKIQWPSPVNPSISPTQATNAFCWAFLDGLLGREVS